METPALPAGTDEGLAAFFAKAEAREPLLGPALVFVPADSRPVFQAWSALLAELRECVFELSDPRVTAVKAGWWVEELEGLSRGAARHPLTRVLARHPAPWARVAATLMDVATELDPPSDLEAAMLALRPLADALVAVERQLFEADDADAEARGRALAIGWLRHRLQRGLEAADRARVPLALFARHGLRREQLAAPDAEALRRDWAGRLHDALPSAAKTRWAYAGLLSLDADRRALSELASGRTRAPGRLHALARVWRAWRLARNAALQARSVPARAT
jgi:hypothetical protein